MIALTRELYVNVTPHSYNLCVKQSSTNKKTGETEIKYSPISYHANLTQAVQAALDYCINKRLADEEISLSDALAIMQEEHKEFREILRSAIEQQENLT